MLTSITQYILPQHSPEVSVVVFTITSIITAIVMTLIPVVISLASARLAVLLDDLSKMTDVASPPSYRWYCKPLTLVVMISVILYMIYTMYMTIDMSQMNIPLLIINLPTYLFYNIGYVLPQQLPSMVFGLLGRHLLVATKAAVATVSQLLVPDGSFLCKKDEVAAMEELRHLEVAIREVCGESPDLSRQEKF